MIIPHWKFFLPRYLGADIREFHTMNDSWEGLEWSVPFGGGMALTLETIFVIIGPISQWETFGCVYYQLVVFDQDPLCPIPSLPHTPPDKKSLPNNSFVWSHMVPLCKKMLHI